MQLFKNLVNNPKIAAVLFWVELLSQTTEEGDGLTNQRLNQTLKHYHIKYSNWLKPALQTSSTNCLTATAALCFSGWGHMVHVITCGEGWQAGHVNRYDKYRFRVWCVPTGTLPYRSNGSIYRSSTRHDLCGCLEKGESILKTELMPDRWFDDGDVNLRNHTYPFLACLQFPLEAASPHS